MRAPLVRIRSQDRLQEPPISVDVDIEGRLGQDGVDALRSGDRRRIEAALRKLFPEVRLRLLRLLGPREDLEDAVQDSLIEIAAALRSFEGRSSLRTFAARITVRVAYRYFGKRRKEPLELVDAFDPDDPESTVASRQTLRKLARCVEKLSEKRRVVFVLCCVEGLPPAEVAELEGVPSLVIRARLLQARTEIARLMRGDPYVESLARRMRAGPVLEGSES